MKSRRRPANPKSDLAARQDAASKLAIAALGFLANDPEALGRFMALTGVGPESIRGAAREPGFLLGVLDYLSGDEELLVAFANQSDIDPDNVEHARMALAGERPDAS